MPFLFRDRADCVFAFAVLERPQEEEDSEEEPSELLLHSYSTLILAARSPLDREKYLAQLQLALNWKEQGSHEEGSLDLSRQHSLQSIGSTRLSFISTPNISSKFTSNISGRQVAPTPAVSAGTREGQTSPKRAEISRSVPLQPFLVDEDYIG